MADLMVGNTTYDTIIDTGTPVSVTTPVAPNTVNGMLSAILAIESILGLALAGTEGSLSNRLARMISAQGGLLYGATDPIVATAVPGQLFWRTDLSLLRVFNSITGQFQDATSVAVGGIGTLQLADLSVTTPKIADLAVTTPKLADLAVTTPKLADLSISTLKIADLAVTDDKVTSITTRAKLPVALAYEDEVNTFTGVNLFTVPPIMRSVAAFSSDAGQLIASDLVFIAKRLNAGYDGGNDVGFISVIETGVWKNLLLQGGGGSVKVGGGLVYTAVDGVLDVRTVTNQRLLSVGSAGNLSFFSSVGSANLTGNAWYDGAVWNKFNVANASSLIQPLGDSATEQISFLTAPAGAPIPAWAERLRISSGSVTSFTEDLGSVSGSAVANLLSLENTSLGASSFRKAAVIKHGSASPAEADKLYTRLSRPDTGVTQDWVIGPGSTPLVSGGPSQLLLGEVPGARLTSLSTILPSAGLIPAANLPGGLSVFSSAAAVSGAFSSGIPFVPSLAITVVTGKLLIISFTYRITGAAGAGSPILVLRTLTPTGLTFANLANNISMVGRIDPTAISLVSETHVVTVETAGAYNIDLVFYGTGSFTATASNVILRAFQP